MVLPFSALPASLYLAEFSHFGMNELAGELLIEASTKAEAQSVADAYANHWELNVFSLTPVGDRQIRLHRLRMVHASSLLGQSTRRQPVEFKIPQESQR